MKNTFTLITGASLGIGRAFAIECAKRNMNLVLVALPTPDLEILAQELKQQYAIQVYHLGIDLTADQAAQSIYDFCQQNAIKIDILINNAGFGAAGGFERHNTAFHEKMIKLNVMAAVLLTHLFIPQLKQMPKAYILNTGSAAAFFDMPYKMIYSATKSFIYSFSRVLQQELKNTHVKVSVVCPGGVDTNEEVKKRTAQLNYFVRKTALTPEYVAKVSIEGMLKGKKLIIPGIGGKSYFLLSKIFPYSFKLWILERILRKTA